MDRTLFTQSLSSGNLLLTGCIFLASIDVTGLLDYGLKALLGGTIWLGFKLVENPLLKKKRTGMPKGEVKRAFPFCLLT